MLWLPPQGFCTVYPCCLERCGQSSIHVVWLSALVPFSQRSSPSLLHSLWFSHHDRHPGFFYYMHIRIYACTLFTVCIHHQNWIATSCKMMRCLSDLFSSMTYHLEYSLCHSDHAFFVQWLTYYASRDCNYECYKHKHSIMNILDFKIKAPSAILMTDCRRDFHVCLCAIASMCISAHTTQYPTKSTQTLGTASMQPMLSGLLSGTMLSMTIMVK